MARRTWLVAADLAMSFMWMWAGALAKLAVYGYLRGWAYHHPAAAEALKVSLAVLYMFFFAWAGKLTGGGSYNPLTVLASAFAGGPNGLLFTAFVRIPAQVIGSIIGVRLIKDTFPSIGHGPHLNVDIHRGALTEGLLTLMIIIVGLGLKKKDPKSFFMKTWISSVSKVTLHILGSDLTGGIMNPASAFGWAYARGDHITLEHLFVYWLAPIQATVVGVWAFRLLNEPKSKKQHSEKDKKDKSD